MVEKNKLDRFEEIAREHNFTDVLEAIDQARRQDKVSVGFIGPFTSRMIHLVNRMFGTTFPESRGEVFNVIVRVEKGAIDRPCQYFYETANGRREVNQDEMSSIIVNEMTAGILVAQVPNQDILDKCCIVVFPGFGINKDIDNRVFGSLALIDYFCYTFSTNLTDTDLATIENPLISANPQCVDFLMTRDSRRDQERADAIYADAINNVGELLAFKDVNVDKAFVRANPEDEVLVKEYEGRLKRRLDELRGTIEDARENKTAEIVREILKKAIVRRKEILLIPPEDVTEQKQKYYQKIQVAESEKNAVFERFESVGARIGLVLKNKFGELKWDFMASVDPADRAEIIRKFLQTTIGEVVADEYRREFGQIDEKDIERTVDRTDVMKALNDLNMKTRRATQVADFFNVVGTAALMTLGPAQGGGNLLEAMAGAILGSKMNEHVLGGLRKINPIVMATDFAADLYRENAFDEYADKMQGLGVAIGRKTFSFINELYLKPKQLEIVAAEDEVKRIEDERRKGLLNASTELRILDAEYVELESNA